MRRATRHDLPELRRLVGDGGVPRDERFDRRMLRDLGGRVAVVENAEGRLVGALSLVFARSFRAGHWEAHLDGMWVDGGSEALVEPMIAAALAAAARRHCHVLRAREPLGAEVAAALARSGATVERSWRLEVPSLPERACGRGRRRRA